MGAPNSIGLLLEIAADPSKAEAALADFTAKNAAAVATVKQSWSEVVAAQMEGTGYIQDAWVLNAASARAYGGAVESTVLPAEAGAAQAARLTEEQMAANRAAVQANIAAYREQAAAQQEVAASSQTFSQGLRANFADLTALRRVLYAAFIPAMFAYLIPELIRLGQEIGTVAQALGGFGEGWQAVMKGAEKDSDQVLQRIKQFPIEMQIATLEMMKASDQAALHNMELLAAITPLGAAWDNVRQHAWEALLGPVGWSAMSVQAALAAYDQSQATKQLGKAYDDLNRDIQALGLAEEKLHKQHKQQADDLKGLTDEFDAQKEALAELAEIEDQARQKLLEYAQTIDIEQQEQAKQAKAEADFAAQLKQDTAALDANSNEHAILAERQKRGAVAARGFVQQVHDARQEVLLMRTQFHLTAGELGSYFHPALQAASADLGNFKVAASDALLNFEQGIGRAVVQAALMQQSVKAAFSQMAKDVISSIAQEAIVQAVKNLALGFYYLAIHDPVDAGFAFHSAALWGSVGGVAAAATAAISAGSAPTSAISAGAGAQGAATGPGVVSSPSAAALAAGGGGTVIYLNIEGVISADNLKKVVNTISAGVQNGSITMISTRSIARSMVRG
jgi:hypothetical protein